MIQTETALMTNAQRKRTLTLAAEEYVKYLQSEYLDSYVASGGSTVKFVATDSEETAATFSASLAATARAQNYLHIPLRADQTRLQLTEELFFAVSRKVDWTGLAANVLRRVYLDLGVAPADTHDPLKDVAVRRVAEANGMHAGELYRTMRRSLEKVVLDDDNMLYHFRVSMLRICQSLLGWGDVDEACRDVVLRWLHGTAVPLPKLRAMGIYGRVARHNARFLFTSFTRWLHMAGNPALVLQLNLARLGTNRKPGVGARRGFYYSKANVLDTYEMLRQFVDSIDELHSTIMVVVLPQQMVNDPQRGLLAYHALYLRVANEVQDMHRANPLAALVHIGTNA